MSETLINGADGEANWSAVVNFHYMQMIKSSVECLVYFRR